MTNTAGRAWVTTEIDENGEECLMLNFSKQLMEDLGWREGDELSLTEGADGCWVISKPN